MRLSRTAVGSLFVVLILSLLIGSLSVAAEDPIVSFNTKSLKYHCPKCEWAVKCTVNCVKIKRSEAVKRGGVPCKVCGGSCDR